MKPPIDRPTPREDFRIMARCENSYHYLPVNDVVMRWGLYLTGAGRGVIPAGEKYPAEGHPGLYDFQWSRGRVLPEFQIILIGDGGGVFDSQSTGEVPIVAGSLLFLFPGVWHRYRPDLSTGWTERWISLHGELAHRLLDLNVLRPNAAVRRARNPQVLANAFDRLIRRVHRAPNQNSLLLSLQTLTLIGTVMDSVVGKDELAGGQRAVYGKSVRDPLVRAALELIWTHSHRALSVHKIADRLTSSRRALERHFREELGHTVLDEIIACRISRAKRLLRETDLGVKTVALMAGFPSEERMRVAFVQTEKASPTTYRRRSANAERAASTELEPDGL